MHFCPKRAFPLDMDRGQSMMKALHRGQKAILLGGLLLGAGMALAPWAHGQAASAPSPTRLRFRSGWVLAAEAVPENSAQPLAIDNVSPHEPEPAALADAGLAAVVVRLDPGRTLGVYDYVLEDGARRQYPCLAVRTDDKAFDAGAWQLEKTSPDRRYTLLFRVPVRPGADPQYTLKFALFGGNEVDPALAFRRVAASGQFTAPGSIPDEGILGLDPNAPKPAEAPPAETAEGVPAVPAVAEAPTAAPAAPPPVPPPTPAAPVRGQQPSAADIEAWNKLLGESLPSTPKEEPPPAPAPDSTAPPAPQAPPAGGGGWDDWN